MIYFVYYLIALVVILMDQFTKYLVVQNMQLGESIPLIEGFLYFTSHRNAGAAFGILQGKMGLFYIATIIVVAVIIYYIHKEAKKDRFLGISLAIVLGGAIGNFIDRVSLGHVIDFIDVYIFTYDFPIFNVADSALVIGVILLILYVLIEEKKQRKA